MKASSNGYVLWEGPSPFDGSPIVAILTVKSEQEKTGNMSQVWILRRDIAPHDAIRSGDDPAVCGRCPMRGRDGRGRACYVDVSKAPRQVWVTYRAGKYGYEDASRRLDGLPPQLAIRWGAYGDPAMLPERLVRAVNARARMHTGYTHQWRYSWAQWCRGVFMASCETREQERSLRSAGWGTFRAGLPGGSDAGRTVLCANERTGATCLECGKCDGRPQAIFIPSHGSGKNYVPAARLARRKATA